jgi:hypothetical protein
MSKLGIFIGVALGLAQIVLLYLAFASHKLVQAAARNMTAGMGVVVGAAGDLVFGIAAIVGFALVFYIVNR